METAASWPTPSPRIVNDRFARAAVRGVIHTDDATAPQLVKVLDLPQAQVRAALARLFIFGEARPEPLIAADWRAQVWRWVPRTASPGDGA